MPGLLNKYLLVGCIGKKPLNNGCDSPRQHADEIKNNKNNSKPPVCPCSGCPCKNYDVKRHGYTKKSPGPNEIVFQLPKYREPRSDTYSHTVYRKEICNRYLMKQHAALAQKKACFRPKKPPVFQQERFNFKTTTETAFRKYNTKEAAACKAKFPRTKQKEEFFFKSGDYTCQAKFPRQPFSHEDYCPKDPIPSKYSKDVRDITGPPFEGMTSYDRDYTAPPLQAYSMHRKARKRVLFD